MRVMLSSTYLDLVEHRRAASEALERLGHQIGRMEIFGARALDATEASLQEVDACDVFVGVYAYRYGYVPSGATQSITEQEFHRALEKNKSPLCFVVAEDYPWPEKFIEPEPGASRLRAFKATLRTRLVVDTFREPLELALRIATAFARLLTANPQLFSVPAADDQGRRKRDEFIRYLELQATRVHAVLDSDFLKNEFAILHGRNVEAIRNGDLLLSHLLTVAVRRLIHDDATYDDRRYCLVGGGQPRAFYDSLQPRRRWDEPLTEDMSPFGSTTTDTLELDTFELGRTSWRDHMLARWVNAVAERSDYLLSEYRCEAALERAAEARGVQRLEWDGFEQVSCPHCRAHIDVGAGRTVKCPHCRTTIEVSPYEYLGHIIERGECSKCGFTETYIKAFRNSCTPRDHWFSR
jgi:Domain of unknown function (DUF4062)